VGNEAGVSTPLACYVDRHTDLGGDHRLDLRDLVAMEWLKRWWKKLFGKPDKPEPKPRADGGTDYKNVYLNIKS
jgi:hypothetical protein